MSRDAVTNDRLFRQDLDHQVPDFELCHGTPPNQGARTALPPSNPNKLGQLKAERIGSRFLLLNDG
jgi:hypothetical protein